jgi:HEAT repeat protein
MAVADPPRLRITAECGSRGADAVVDGCVALLAGGAADEPLVVALGGRAAPRYLNAPPGQRYWLRVWAARGLLWAPWRPQAAPAVVAALTDEAWRVREMAAKVVARHRVGEAFDAVTGVLHDPVPRVRSAASRALRLLTAAGA